MDNSSIFFLGAEYNETVLCAMSGPELVKLYNEAARAADLTPVKRFSNKETAEKRTLAVLRRVGDRAAPESPEDPAELIREAAVTKETSNPPAPAQKPRAFRGTHLFPPGFIPKPCREGSKQSILLDMLRREEGATMPELLRALSGGRKPWQEITVRAGFGWDMKQKGYGVRSEMVDGQERFFLILPRDSATGKQHPIPPHTPLKGTPKADARQINLEV